MRTPEEIKKGLKCCKVGLSWATTCAKGCPYMNEPAPGGKCELALLKDALALIQQLEAQAPKWISVEERLPEDEEYVLCWYKDEFGSEWSTVGMKIQWGCGWDLDIDDGSGRSFTVTHWMPLPEPPKEEER